LADEHARARAGQEAAFGDALYRQAKFSEACAHYRDAVRLRESEPIYHYKLACAAWRSDATTDARDAFLAALRLDPRHVWSHEGLGQWYLEDGALDRALFHSTRALELTPGDPDLAVSQAFVLHTLGRAQEAWQLIEPLIARGHESGRLALLFSRMARPLKQDGRALNFTENLLKSAAIAAPEKPALHFAASSLLDKMGRYEKAFEHARAGKEMTRRPYDPDDHSRRIDRRIAYFTPRKMHDLPRASHRNRRPVFIIGMPRSGTSLIEQILASHPQVYGAGELDTISKIAGSTYSADWTDGEPYPENMDAISVRKANRLAAQYLDGIARRNSTATYVTDKMPMNFMYLGLIQVLFPDCHVIHCTRDPMDTCLSCYMTHFAAGHEFTHDLGHLASFYRDYRRLMEYWRVGVNVPLIDMNYERVVADLEGQTRRLLQFLDLPWNDRCLRFFENPRPANTASTDQVRQPLYASSVGRWKHYEPHLRPLMDGLALPSAA
jgi:tetratricopeptide (TPR) repeat protein